MNFIEKVIGSVAPRRNVREAASERDIILFFSITDNNCSQLYILSV